MKKRGRKTLLSALRGTMERNAIHDMTFTNLDLQEHGVRQCLTAQQLIALEKIQKKKFDSWYRSWIEPLLIELEKKEK